ncbi:FtsX-like permease family protein [Roseivirga pacifica]|uniref:FtsX-like permease family protein n=1 Tax=Roseivirga pacifica TaxID=1267423 RepID=UPI00227A0CFA|nr:FtsX-like permease family protein [Roseivirga pacifica]
MSRRVDKPPKWLDRLFGWLCRSEELEVLRGDLYELYAERLAQKGRAWANFFYFFEVFDLLRPFALKRTRNTTQVNMFKTYLMVAYRNVINQKVFSFINISGLAIGLTCFVLIALFIQNELSYDKFHENSDRIYRLVENFESEGVGEHSASLPFPTGPTLAGEYPAEVKQQVRFFNFQSPTVALAYKEANKAFNESRFFFADSSFLSMFDFALVQGNPRTALDNPNALLITESMAQKYFGDEDPMGKVLEFQGQQPLQVTGVLADAPLNAHFQFDFIASFSSLKYWYGGTLPRTWYWNPCWTYVLLEHETDATAFEAKLPDFVNKYFPDFIREDVTMELQPLEDIHLHSKLDYEIAANSNISNIYIFGAIAVFVLFIAAVNFINLSTAKAAKRGKEVGVRKSLGSKKSQLITQFIFESVLFTFIAIVVALGLVALLLPAFNNLIGKSIAFGTLFQPQFVIGGIAIGLIVGLLSGIYPAFILSNVRTVSVLKGERLKARGVQFRKVLVTAQFAISMFLIVGTVVAISQSKLLLNEDPGFESENVLLVPVIRSGMGQHYEGFRNRALQSPYIKSVTAVEEVIGEKHQVNNYQYEGMDRSKPFPRFFVRHDFTETMGIKLVAGRDYDREFVTDDTLAHVVNEAMVKAMGWGSPQEAIGKKFYHRNELMGKVVGVVEDYNFISKHHNIGPIVIDLKTMPGAFNLFIKYMAVRVDGENLQQSISDLDKAWASVLPDRPFDFFFLDDRLEHVYAAEQTLGTITVIFSVLAIIVACLGVFGLVTFSVERRTKELGIRKVLGIRNTQIIGLVSKEFLLLILLAFLISIPASYFLIEAWLTGFAYRVDLQVWPFVFAGAVTLIICMGTVLFHTRKVAKINPAVTLKYE